MYHYFVGQQGKQLFCVYHPPVSSIAKAKGVLLCNPVGHEYLRSHWAMRQMAVRLSSGGCHVLRFDYSCTGDSAGSIQSSDIEHWVKDVETAACELRNISSVEEIALVGLRLGSWLALKAAENTHGVSNIVLWDPIVSGLDYLHKLKEFYIREYFRDGYFSAQVYRASRNFPDEILGLATNRQMVDIISKINIIDSLRSFHKNTFVLLSSSESVSKKHFKILKDISHNTCGFKVCEDKVDWKSYDTVAKRILPSHAIQRVCREISPIACVI